MEICWIYCILRDEPVYLNFDDISASESSERRAFNDVKLKFYLLNSIE